MQNMYNTEDSPVNIGLVLLAAGFGSRFGGDKQLSIIGPEESTIIDYTIYDAHRIGYSWVTVILREEIVEDFEREVAWRWRGKIALHYSIQHRDSYIPTDLLSQPYVEHRQRPWGTAHALLCAAEQIHGPFAVVNADDFYGYHAMKEIFFYLRQTVLNSTNCGPILPQAMVAFQLGRTLSENGAVSRGICHSYFDAQGGEWLAQILEHSKLIRADDQQIHSIGGKSGEDLILEPQNSVSMNLFGLQPSVFPYLEQQFSKFLNDVELLLEGQGLEDALKKEFYLPTAVEVMLEKQQTMVAMLHSPDPWFGLTYLKDLPIVRQKICLLIEAGEYPASLFA